jgi:D-xylose 1-dehydrogenase (NADP+, D-xylono-1,5-lactone-forming)
MGVRWGLLSTARINTALLAGARTSDEVDVVAVGSRDLAKAEAYAREHGLETAHGSYEALLADPGVDAIYISLPNGPHVEWSIRALEAGKHVLCEKPLTRRVADAERAFDAADAAGRLLMEAFMWRHNPQTQTIAKLVADGAIGQLRLVRTTFSFMLGDSGDVRLDPALDGGALMDLGCYCISGVRLLAGEPEAVAGHAVTTAAGVDTRFTATLRHGGDVLTTFDCGFDLPPRRELQAIGTEGVLSTDDPWHSGTGRIQISRPDGGAETIDVTPRDSYRLELENFGAAIRGTAAPLLGRADAIGQARTIEALYASAAGGGATTIL